MENFETINVTLPKCKNVTCEVKELSGECFLWITVSGTCSDGSQGENYGAFLYQKIGLALLKTEPLAVLIDLQGLQYRYGTKIMKLFQIFSDVRTAEGTEMLTAYVLSDKNKSGLSSLCSFEINNPKPPFFYNLQEAYKHLYKEYDEI